MTHWIAEPMSGSKLKAKSRPSKTSKRKPKKAASITPQQFVAAVGAIDTDIQNYRWTSYGPYAFFLDAAFPVNIGSAQIIFDIVTNEICEMHACDYGVPANNQAWRWINPKYRAAHIRECRRRGFKNDTFAWDRVKWVPASPARLLARIKVLRNKISLSSDEPPPAKEKTRRGK